MTKHSSDLVVTDLNGQRLDAFISIYVDQSDLSLEDVIGDAEDQASLERKISRGDLMIADVVVKATIAGVEGLDSLGGCYVSSHEDIQSIVTDHGMIQLAIDDLKKNMLESYSNLKPYFKQQA